MQPSSKVKYLIGSANIIEELNRTPSKEPFSTDIIDFLNDVSKRLMKDTRSKDYSDVITFAFWIRKGSLLKLKERFEIDDRNIHLGKGTVFHIAPSNVPVNFAYSLVAGLITGNSNVVRAPSKEYDQVRIIVDAFNDVLAETEEMKPYLTCVQYDRDKEINDFFSAIADMRIVWGGDQTIAELRKSPIGPRTGEITFADRYSLAVIDSDSYMAIDDKKRVAEDFYNDTFLTDQNACTSPRVVAWMGTQIEKAKDIFWKLEHDVVMSKYKFQPIQGVNKLTSAYLAAASGMGVKVVPHDDNLIIRIEVAELTNKLMDYRDNSGFFYEYDCRDILNIRALCDDKRCQTLAYIGKEEAFLPLIKSGIKGVDRIVPIGRTMDFDLIWDGYKLPALLTRTITK